MNGGKFRREPSLVVRILRLGLWDFGPKTWGKLICKNADALRLNYTSNYLLSLAHACGSSDTDMVLRLKNAGT